jgi:hypothetical protein
MPAKKMVNSFGKNKRPLSNAEVSRRADAAQKRVNQLNKNTNNAGPYAAYSAPVPGDYRFGSGAIRIEKDIMPSSRKKSKVSDEEIRPKSFPKPKGNRRRILDGINEMNNAEKKKARERSY